MTYNVFGGTLNLTEPTMLPSYLCLVNSKSHGAAVSDDDGLNRKSVERIQNPAGNAAAAADVNDEDDDNDDAVGDVICCRERDASSHLPGNQYQLRQEVDCDDVSKMWVRLQRTTQNCICNKS